jgi:hypothetical protein
MLPVLKTFNGTTLGTAAFIVMPDIFQNPFSIAWSINPTGATYTLQATTDWSTCMQPTWNGSTGVNWVSNPNGTTAVSSGIALSGNYAFPVAALRLLVTEATDTGTVVFSMIQSVNSP